MSQEHDPEDLAAFGVLEELAHGGGREDTTPVRGEDEATEVLRRLHLEGMGLLAYELEPERPRADLRAEILAHLAGDETQEVVEEMPSLIAPAPKPQPVAATRPGPLMAFASPAAAAVAARPAESRGPKRSRWPALLAALFALAAIGLGVWAAQLATLVDAREARIRRLESDLGAIEKLKAEIAELRGALAAVEQRHVFATTPSTTIFVLRPPVEGALQPLASGALYVAADHQHWQLEVRGLKPEPEVQDYQLWFLVDGLPKSGGVFDAKLGKTALLAEATMPRGTSAVAITLERKGGVQSPTSPILLTAQTSVQL